MHKTITTLLVLGAAFLSADHWGWQLASILCFVFALMLMQAERK